MSEAKEFNAAAMRAVTIKARKHLGGGALSEVGHFIEEAAERGDAKVNIDKIRCGVETELKKLGFSVLPPDSDCKEWTVLWSNPDGSL